MKIKRMINLAIVMFFAGNAYSFTGVNEIGDELKNKTRECNQLKDDVERNECKRVAIENYHQRVNKIRSRHFDEIRNDDKFKTGVQIRDKIHEKSN